MSDVPLPDLELDGFGFFALSVGLVLAGIAIGTLWGFPLWLAATMVLAWHGMLALRIRDAGGSLWLAACPVGITAAAIALYSFVSVHSDSGGLAGIALAAPLWFVAMILFATWACFAPSRRAR